jgi:hypothetical protein
MRNSSIVTGGARRTALLLIAGASVGLVLTDTMTKVQGAVSEMRATYEPCVRSKMTGDWMCGDVMPAALKARAKVAAARKVL